MIKTLTFWLEGVTDAESKMLREIMRALGDAHREAAKIWIRLACDGEAPAMGPFLQAGKDRAREQFAKTGYNTQLWNGYSVAEAFKQFRLEWAKINKGERASIPFPGDAPFVYLSQISRHWELLGEGEDRSVRIRLLHQERQGQRPEFVWRLKSRAKLTGGRRAKRRGGFRDFDNLAAATKIGDMRIRPDEEGHHWLVHISVHLPDAPDMLSVTKAELWAGVDLGMNEPAVLSVPDVGCARHFGRREYTRLWDRIDRFEERKRELNRAKQFSEARALRGKIGDLRQHVNELISREIVKLLLGMKVTGLRVEDLKGIQNAATGKLKFWPRYHLVMRLEQKCKEVGIAFEKVKPAGTSQTCSSCGHRARENRNGANFKCVKCGFARHADVNAANNIARAMKAFGPCAGQQSDLAEPWFGEEGRQHGLDPSPGTVTRLQTTGREPS